MDLTIPVKDYFGMVRKPVDKPKKDAGEEKS